MIICDCRFLIAKHFVIPVVGVAQDYLISHGGVNTHLSGERVLVNTHMKNFLDNLSNSGQAVRLYGEGRH
jgi:hypothetical protein